MDVIASLMNGILVALEPINLGLAIVGVIVGLFVGAMPGLGSVNGVAILLPFTFVIQGFTGGATDLFAKVYASADWQKYKSKKSLMGDLMSGDALKAYWADQIKNHTKILKASGAIK